MAIPTFPQLPGITFPRERDPWVPRDSQVSYSGRQSIAPRAAFPYYKYTITMSVLRGDSVNQELQTFQGFWNTVNTTPGGYFQYYDPEDNNVTDQLMGLGDGVTTSFPAVRTLGGFTEPVSMPFFATPTISQIVDCGNVTDSVGSTDDAGNVTDSVGSVFDDGLVTDTHFYVNGVEVPATISTGGMITFATAPAAGAQLSWSGSYNWLCQFDEDSAQLSNFMYLLWEMKKITFRTARV